MSFFGENVLCKILSSILYSCTTSRRLRPMLWYNRRESQMQTKKYLGYNNALLQPVPVVSRRTYTTLLFPKGFHHLHLDMVFNHAKLSKSVDFHSFLSQSHNHTYAQKHHYMNYNSARQLLEWYRVGFILTLCNASSSCNIGMIIKYSSLPNFVTLLYQLVA